MFAFLCYKFSITITRILVKIEIFDNDIALIRNDYFVYSIKEIKRDLENVKVYYRESSGINIEFDTEKTRVNQTVKVLGYLILETISLKDIAIPIGYSQELYEKLYYLNDHFSIEKKRKIADIIRDLPKIIGTLHECVFTGLGDKDMNKYLRELSDGTYLLEDYWFFKEQ